MALFLGIDGGGSGCRAQITDREGRVIGAAQAGPANIVSDLDGACENILAAVTTALNGIGDMSDLHAVLGLAGANLPQAAQALQARLPFASTRIVSDALIALRGAVGVRDGVLAAIGTGSVFAAQNDGRVRQIGGWGLAFGDEGSGAWIGRALLTRALHAVDLRCEMTPLLRDVLMQAGGAETMVETLRLAPPSLLATYARRVVNADQDQAAQAVLAAAEAEILDAISVLQQGSSLPVTFTGGLGPIFATRLANKLGAPLYTAQGTALDGAVALAREGVAA